MHQLSNLITFLNFKTPLVIATPAAPSHSSNPWVSLWHIVYKNRYAALPLNVYIYILYIKTLKLLREWKIYWCNKGPYLMSKWYASICDLRLNNSLSWTNRKLIKKKKKKEKYCPNNTNKKTGLHHTLRKYWLW